MMAPPQSLIYSFVARGKIVIAEYSAFVGNFPAVAVQCLDRLQPETNKKASYSRDGFAFNFLSDGGFSYCSVTEDGFSRAVAFAFLTRIKEDFLARYGGGKAEAAFEHSLDKFYGPRLKEEMELCEKNPGEFEKVAGLRQQVSEVKNVMLNNIDSVMSRGIKMEDLEERTDVLRNEALRFQDSGRRVQRKMWYNNLKVKGVVIGLLVILALVIWLSICHGFTCSSGGSSSTTTATTPPGTTSTLSPPPPFGL